MNNKRRIAHLDMDAFYASVELIRYPELRGQPVVIGGRNVQQPAQNEDGHWHFAHLKDYTGRGVITTSTYEARALGVFSGMGLMKAAQKAPEAILLPVDFEAYRHYSRQFKTAISAITPHIEDRGIDEIYIDLSKHPKDTHTLAMHLKHAVLAATGLSCSIGVAENKLLAKICSDLNKPNGLTILDSTEIPQHIWPLSVRKINGIGPKATEKLAALHIHTIGELAHTKLIVLQTHFGHNYGTWLHQVSHGIDNRSVITHSEPKSLSRETTFERDLHVLQDRSILSGILTRLCQSLANDLERKGYKSRTIGIKIRFDDFHTVTRDLTLDTFVSDTSSIRCAARECLRRIDLNRKIRLLGIRASTLCPKNAHNTTQAAWQPELPFLALEEGSVNTSS